MVGKIYWTKNNGELDFEKEPPFPSFNNLQDRISYNAHCYVNQNMENIALSLFEKASREILAEDNRLREQIKQLKIEKQEQLLLINKLTEQLQKWTSQQAGRKTLLTDEQQQQIKKWKAENISNRVIAKRLKVSEGTIRNEIKRMGTDV